ncbi:MAG: LPS assembly lipoprotein LptE [Paludibacteraceae bacterium]|nr:LPS assembly lipoprotein LptE [Paludibacteraceae bacterium]
MKYIYYILLIGILSSCSISYKFNGASIDYSTTKSIAIADFPNNAALVHPPLSNQLSEEIRDLFTRQTRLTVTRKDGDLELEGEIIGYELTPMGIGADGFSAETKLTITIRVRYTNNVNPDDSFERTYSAYQTFNSQQMLTDVQDALCETMVKELSENIYNDTVAKW